MRTNANVNSRPNAPIATSQPLIARAALRPHSIDDANAPKHGRAMAVQGMANQ